MQPERYYINVAKRESASKLTPSRLLPTQSKVTIMSLSIKTKPTLSVLRKRRTLLVQQYVETDCILRVDYITDLERAERVARLNHIENQLDEVNELIRVAERSSQ